MCENNRGAAGFLLGLSVGVGLGILFAPRSGRATRGRIREVAEEGQDLIERKVRNLRHEAEDCLEQGLDALTRQKDRVMSAIKA